MAAVSVNVSRTLAGWGRSSWSSGAWNESITGTLDVNGLLGTATSATPDALVNTTGVSTSGNIGSVLVSEGPTNILVTGVNANGGIGTILVWGVIDTSQTPNWQEIKEAA